MNNEQVEQVLNEVFMAEWKLGVLENACLVGWSDGNSKKERGFHYRGSGTGMPHNSNYMPRLIGATIEPVVLKITSFEPQVDYNNQYLKPDWVMKTAKIRNC